MFKAISENADANTVAAQASVTCNKSPHLPNRQMEVLFDFAGITAAGTVKIQGTDDDASIADGAAAWTDLATVSVGIGGCSKVVTIQSMKRLRTNVTVAHGAGAKVSAYAVTI